MTNSVTYSLAIKRNLPNYQNYTPFYSVSRDVQEGQTEEEVFDELEALVEKRMGIKVDQLDEELGRE